MAKVTKLKKCFGCLSALVLTVTLLMFKNSLTVTRYLKTTVADNEEVEEPALYINMYQQRINQVHQVCDNLVTPRTTTRQLQFSHQYRIAYKHIAKVGTTSGLAIFYILNDVNTENGLDSRKELHKQYHNTVDGQTMFHVETLKKYKILFPSRDPYTRLYSAFIDKVYIFNSKKLVSTVLNYARENGNFSSLQESDVNFQMFLDYILDQSLSEHVIGGHYYPIFNRNTFLCWLQDFIIIKQENFSADMEYALKAVNVEKEKMEDIRNVLYSRRAELSVAAIVKTVIGGNLESIVQMGQFKEGAVFVLTRLWNSFQLQGYIDAKSNFPFEKFLSSSSVSDVDYVLSIFCEEMKQHPLSHSASKQQRELAIQAAYANIKEDTMRKIQEVYKLDFKAFGYNSNWSK